MTATEERPDVADGPVTEIGRARKRKEDQHLITGRTTWTDNLSAARHGAPGDPAQPDGARPDHPVDVSPALSRPGVLAAFSGRDFAETQGSIPCAWPVTPDMVNPGHPSLAVDVVNHVGEAVAVVVARDKAAAQDALEAIDIDYEPLPVVLDMEAALADGAEQVHAHTESNRSYTWTFESGAAGTGAADRGGARPGRGDRAPPVRAAAADPGVHGAPLDRGAAAAASGFTMWSATQVPHILRLMLALTLGVPEHKVRVIAPDVGGGFGGKLQVTPEEVITALVARRLGKPVKYTESRSESLMSAHHGRDQIQDITITARRDGTVTGLDVHLFADMGAYLRLVSPGVPILGAFMFNSIYKFDAYRFVCEGVFTTKTPTDAYRGAGRPEATFAVERIMDELAVELGMDRMELRRKNWISHEEFPFTTVAGLTYDSGNYEAATDRALELFGWDELVAEQADRRARKDPVQLGLGISTFTEMCGLAPSRVLGALSYAAGGWETATIRMLPSGKVEVITGTSPHGQGHETAWSQIVADQLGVPFEDIEVIHGDTQSSPRGLDSYGSRSLVVGGIAVVQAAQKVIAKARRLAAHLLEANEDDLEFAAGSFTVKGSPGSSKSLAELAFAVFSAHDLPEGMEPDLDSTASFDPENFSLPARHPPVRDRGRHRDRFLHHPPLRLRRRHRRGDQPADRGRPGARRPGPGHRAGALRGGGLRRGGQPDHRLVRGLPAALGGRPAELHHRPDGQPVHHQPARGQGCRRGRHDRLHPGGGQRRRRRAAAVGHQRRADAVHPGTGLAGHLPGGGEVRPGSGRHGGLGR